MFACVHAFAHVCVCVCVCVQAEKLAAEGRAAAGIARARGEAAVTQALIDAENLAKLSQVLHSARVYLFALPLISLSPTDDLLCTL